jgi:hypothetical protein
LHVSAIIAAGGRGSRFGGTQPKQLQLLAGIPILKRTVDAFLNGYAFDEVVVALPADLAANPPSYLDDVIVVEGGERRPGFGCERRSCGRAQLAGDRHPRCGSAARNHRSHRAHDRGGSEARCGDCRASGA